MTIFVNLAVLLFYASASVVIGLNLPLFFEGIDADEAATTAGVLFIACALVHEVMSRRARTAELEHMVKARTTSVMGELRLARNEVKLIHEAITAVSRKGGRTGELASDMDRVVTEVQMLQDLISQISDEKTAREAGAMAARAATAAARAAGHTVAAAPIERRASGPAIAVAEAGRRAAGAPSDPGNVVPWPDTPPMRQVVEGLGPVAVGLDDDAILQIIRDGLQLDRVDLVLQPIVSLPQRRIRFMEAFTRIRADNDSIILPEQYIAIAEREGLITAIDNLLLLRCVQMLRNMRARDRNFDFFCNISPYTLADGRFFHDFVNFMLENEELAPFLVFEFSQATIANYDAEIVRQLRQLAGIGFRYSLDQVTSLSLDFQNLHDHHFRFVKIEASALIDGAGSPEQPLSEQVQRLKKSLERQNIDLIVEKIEDEKTLLELNDYQIDFGQGYLFGAPRLSRNA